MNKDQIQSLIRAALVSVGGSLVAKGLISSSQLTDVIGAVMAILPIIWSIYQKRESAKLPAAVATVNAALANGDADHGVTEAGSKTVVISPL